MVKNTYFVLSSICVFFSHSLTFALLSDPDTGGASRLCRGDSGGETGEDASAHRILFTFSVAQPGWGGAPSRPLPGKWFFFFFLMKGMFWMKKQKSTIVPGVMTRHNVDDNCVQQDRYEMESLLDKFLPPNFHFRVNFHCARVRNSSVLSAQC